MKKIEEYTPYELAELSVPIVVIISKKLSGNLQAIDIVGHFIKDIGQRMLIIADTKKQKKNESGDNEKGLL